MDNFKNKKIAVVGSGIEGKSSEEFLKKHGAEVTVLDKSEGDNYLSGLDSYDLIVRSPGVKISDLEKHTDRKKIVSQTKLFFDLCPAKIIGVTGTKGKGTTSTLIYEMLKKDQKDAYLGGNIGVPPFEFLDKLNKDSWVVLELSSFQLHDLHKSPHIAVVLMITSEHLDYHKDTYEYIDAKRNILRFQTPSDFAVINRDYPVSNESDVHTQAKVLHISREREVDEGAFSLGGQILLRVKGENIPIVDNDELQLKGEHNQENACAAVVASFLAGVQEEAIRAVLREFKGLEHRIELAGIINGVEYYNDSFSTTPETAIAAIESFKNPEILVLGGSSKNSDFTELGATISRKQNIKGIIGVGDEWPRIKEKITSESSALIVEGATNMNQIVLAASKMATPGDVVILTPACASFGMFKNYKERGIQFKEEVIRLKN